MKKAFTLAELLLCLGIIGVVSAMGMVIAKHGTDRAYNLFYYSSYVNLYNAIADAKASGCTTNREIMEHVDEVLSSTAANSLNSQYEVAQSIDFLNLATYKAYYIDNTFVTTPDNQRPEYDINQYQTDAIVSEPKQPEDENEEASSENNDADDGDDDNGAGGEENSVGGWPSPGTSADIETSTGVDIYYPNNLEDGLNGVAGLAGVANAVPLTITIPQRQTRTNNGIATVHLVYVDTDNGYLIPVADGSSVNLQLRRDLLPVYIDDGKVGRNNVINRANFDYEPIKYYNYRDAVCTLRNGDSIGNLVNCDAYTSAVPRTGVLKFADPRKAR